MRKKCIVRPAALGIIGVALLLSLYGRKLAEIVALPAQKENAALSPEALLGKQLFEDSTLSQPAGVSCASCHDPRHAFQGNNRSPVFAVPRGSKADAMGHRNVPTLMYMAYSPAFSFVEEKNEEGNIEHTATGGQFWDGRADSLSEQAQGPLLNATEMNNPSKAVVVQKVAASSYAALMREQFGDDVFDDVDKAFEVISNALALFQNTALFSPFSSKFDAYLQGRETLDAQESKGFALFKDPQKGNCMACHAGKEESRNPQDWLFTDFTYDAVGVPRNRQIPMNANVDYYDLGLCKQPDIASKAPAGFNVNSLCGAFKVPTLRNIAVTAPYMHNGSLKTLRDVVAFYATRDTNPQRWYPKDANGLVEMFDDLPAAYHANVNSSEAPYDRKLGETPRLNDAEIDAIVAFLGTLTDTPMR